MEGVRCYNGAAMSVRRSTRALLLLLVMLHAGSLACARQPPHPLPAPVVLIGVDGLEWRVVLQLAREGRLPTIRR